PSPSTLFFGNSVSITVSGSTSYSWSPSNGLSSVTDASVTASPAAFPTRRSFDLDGNGCVDSTTASVLVNPLPVIAVNPASSTICFGKSVSITASGATSYSWSPSYGLSSVTDASVTASPAASVTYNIVGTDGNGCV